VSAPAGDRDRPTHPFPPDPILVDTLNRLLGTVVTHEAVQAAEATGWAGDIWDRLADTGAPWVGVPEEAGGSGGTLADAAAVLRVCGRFAAPLPVAETGLLGGWLATAGGLALPEGPLTVVPGRPEDRLELRGDRLSGVAHNVAWASTSALILALVDDTVVAVEPAAARVEPRRNVAGEPREVVRFEDVAVAGQAPAPPGVDPAALRLRGAFTRACLMVGALERAAEVSVDYAGERQQFGRPIATFQAVAAQLVRLASETHLAAMALETAVAAASHRGLEGARLEVGAAKAVAGEAADVVTARAHQVHGAIGMTQEYVLHQLTRRLWSWREEYGSTVAWRREVGRTVAAAGVDRLWPVVTEGSAALTAAAAG
jgi:acyl-CoA dehydrogenase